MKVNYMISTAAVLAALLTVSCAKDLQENTPVSGKDSDKVTLLIAADEVTKTTFGDKGDFLCRRAGSVFFNCHK